MTTKEPTRTDARRIDLEPNASGGYSLEYPYQGVETPSESMEPDPDPDPGPDTLAAVTDETRSARNRRKHAQRRSS